MEGKIRTRKSSYEDYLKQIPNWNVPKINKKDAVAFFKDYELGKITDRISGESTLEHYVLYLRLALEFLKKPTVELTEKDIDKFSAHLLKDKIKTARGTPFAESVKVKLRRTLSQFIAWKIKDPQKTVLLVQSLKVKYRQVDKTPEFLTEREVDKLYNACKTSDERYLVAMLFSSGARSGEFFNIRKEDIELPEGSENFVKVTLREEFSKTKGRTISLYYKHSLEAVSEFLRMRIREGIEPSEPVWNQTYMATSKKLNRYGIMKRKGKIIGKRILDRRICSKLFRSSCATWLANRLNRQQMCYYFGWRFSSPMPDIYIARRGIRLKDVDDKLTQTEMGDLKAQLSKQVETSKIKGEEMEKLRSQLKTLEIVIEKRSKLDPILNKLLRNPKVLRMIESS